MGALDNPGYIMEMLAIWAVPVIMAITFHEAAHGYVANKFGDPTALMLGRITLNPIKHIDLFGTILMPALLVVMGLPALGYAKPVPVNFRNIKPFKLGTILVAAAGPLMNLFLVVCSLLVIVFAAQFPPHIAEFPIKMAWASVQINTVIMIFNMLPIPPLDGSRILSVLLPPRLAIPYDKLEPYGMWIVLLLVISGLMFQVLNPLIQLTLRVAHDFLKLFL